MDISAMNLTQYTQMSKAETAKVNLEVDRINKENGLKRVYKEGLEKNDFLKLLITQLENQDPTRPMEDKEFIAQMAQFSALEQMTNMNQGFERLNNVLTATQAVSLLGKTVEISDGDSLVTGVVKGVTGRDKPQLLVNGNYFDFSQIEKIRE